MCICVYANLFIKIIMKQQKLQKNYAFLINVSLIFKNKRHFKELYLAIFKYLCNNWNLFINMQVLGFCKQEFCKMRCRTNCN